VRAGPPTAVRAELVLVGGGHAHVQVLRALAMEPVAGVRVTLVLDRPEAVYSGMVPGFAAGDYDAAELEIDVVPLARRAGARVVLSAALRVDPAARRIELEGRAPIAYDVASLDVGSVVRGLELPGVREHALATRPIRHFVDRLEAALAREAGAGGPAPRIAVVGGGAAGVELSACLAARLRAARRGAALALVTDEARLLRGHGERLADAASRALAASGVEVRSGARVEAVEKDALVLAGGERVACDLALWATGAAPPPAIAASPLPKDAAGFVRVEDSLAVAGCEGLFAAGDCASLEAHPWVPKAGVYAVRQGPVLTANLRAALAGRPLRRYRPQRGFLALLNLGGGRALGGKWGLVASGRAVWRLKDRIDRRFVERFRVLGRARGPGPGAGVAAAEPMACGGCAAKLGAPALVRALARLGPGPRDPSVLVGLAEADDAAAVALPGGGVLLATLDGFRAFTDDPFLVGRVAAVNALSDVYAKGGRPRHALALVTVPDEDPARGEETLVQVLAGVRAALDPLGVSLVGGHTTTGPELFVGLAVTGDAPEGERPLGLDGLRPGDALILTKPLGTGVVFAADALGRAPGLAVQAALACMLLPNAEAARAARAAGARACTDVSGFGLAGHLAVLLRASGVAARVELDALPALPGVRELLALGVRSTAHSQNAAAGAAVELAPRGADHPLRDLLFDPQTSGGLLFGVAPDRAAALLRALPGAARIGEVVRRGSDPGADPLRDG
jgi:selenide,water dikinase